MDIFTKLYWAFRALREPLEAPLPMFLKKYARSVGLIISRRYNKNLRSGALFPVGDVVGIFVVRVVVSLGAPACDIGSWLPGRIRICGTGGIVNFWKADRSNSVAFLHAYPLTG